jgi:RsiW-degrading membrane proteinase PrsW (M82 family)
MANRGRGYADPYPQSRFGRSPETIDRILVIACAVVWLAFLGVGVAATVALVDLVDGHPVVRDTSNDSNTPWLLYVVIGISALVILAAIPLLLRARRAAIEESTPAPRPQARLAVDRDPPDYPGPTPARYSATVISVPMLDRMWLRCGVGVLTATGVAMIAVATATYLMAVERDSAAWAAYIVAAVITVGMTAIPVFYLRQLRAALSRA